MKEKKRNISGLSLIFHSSCYDRIHHGLSLASAALALGRKVKFFFSYGALAYLSKKKMPSLEGHGDGDALVGFLETKLREEGRNNIGELIALTKKMGAVFYACTGSMALLNISRDELVDEVNKSMGITTFLTEAEHDQILFI